MFGNKRSQQQTFALKTKTFKSSKFTKLVTFSMCYK